MPDKKQEVPKAILDKEGLTVSKIGGTKQDILVPKNLVDDKEFMDKYSRISNSFAHKKDINTSNFLNLLNYYITSVLETQVSQRMERYKQMDFIIENDGAISLARRVLRDEILQADVFGKPITVTAKKPDIKKAIEKLFKDLGITSLIPECGNNLISYGDSFWILDIDPKMGIQKAIPVDPKDVRHRFEFSLAEIKANKDKLVKKYNGLQTIIELGASVKSSAKDFNRVLLGFQILNTIFPFWQVLHFRKFTTRKPLYPFGMPTFYESQSEARMYLNAKVVVSMIRSSAFMREHIQVKTAEDMDPMEQWDVVNQVRQMMELFISRGGKTSRDYPSFGERFYYPEGLITVDKMEAGYNFRDRFEDLELMREDVFTSTGMPKGYFVGEGGQYVPIKALMQQDKKTARMVYDLQSIIISQLIKLIETHFAFTKEFDPYKEEYAISLPYPIPDIDDSMIGISQAKMNYAISTMDNLKNSLQITKIPEPVVRDILIKYFPFNDEEIVLILKQMMKDSDEAEDKGIDPHGVMIGDPYQMGAIQADQMKQMGVEGGVPPEGGSPEAGAQAPPQAGVPKQPTPQKVPQQQMASAENNKKKYIQEFKEAIQKKPLYETFEECLDKKIMSNFSEDFVFMKRHYVSNNCSTPDRNSKGIVSLSEDIETAKKVTPSTYDKGVYIEGMNLGPPPKGKKKKDPTLSEEVPEDIKQDRRYIKDVEKFGTSKYKVL